MAKVSIGKLDMPRIGDNGNWYLGNKDTGVKARVDTPIVRKTISEDKSYFAIFTDMNAPISFSAYGNYIGTNRDFDFGKTANVGAAVGQSYGTWMGYISVGIDWIAGEFSFVFKTGDDPNNLTEKNRFTCAYDPSLGSMLYVKHIYIDVTSAEVLDRYINVNNASVADYATEAGHAETAITADTLQSYGVVAGGQPNFSNSGLYFLVGDIKRRNSGDISMKGVCFTFFVPPEWDGNAIGIQCRMKGDSGLWNNIKYCIENNSLGDESSLKITDDINVTPDWFTAGQYYFETTSCNFIKFV